MATGNGNFFSHGITFGATIEAEQIVPVFPSRAEDAVRFILFVDDDGVAITPEIIPAASGADVGEGRVAGLRYSLPSVAYIQALEARIEALEATQWVPTEIKTADYTAAAWEHVYIKLDGLAPSAVTITMPSSPNVGDRVRVTDVTNGGGVSVDCEIKIACTFAAVAGAYYATSPYTIAPNGDGFSKEGATIELEYTSGGWLIVQESFRPQP